MSKQPDESKSGEAMPSHKDESRNTQQNTPSLELNKETVGDLDAVETTAAAQVKGGGAMCGRSR